MKHRLYDFAALGFVLSVCVAIAACSWPAVTAAQPKWPLPEGIKSIDVDGYPLSYLEAGQGVPIVLVHGSLSDYRTWHAQVPMFGKIYRVIALNLRHYYPEKWNGQGDDFSIGQHAADVAMLVRKLGLGKVHLIGHSRGGAVVISVAKTYPEIIRTLTLADASGLEALLPDTPDNQKLAAEGRQMREILAKHLAAGDIETGAQLFIDSLGGPGTWAHRPADQKQITLDNIATAVKPEVRPVTTCEQIAKFDFPILLLNGERSPKRYGLMFAEMRKCRNIEEPVVIPNAAHSMNRDNPGRFNRAVLEFLSGR